MVKTIAIIGRPNVGKSTLFNRLVGKNKAIVADTPGVTRDYNSDTFDEKGNTFELIDTAGIEEKNNKKLSEALRESSKKAIKRAEEIIFLVDVRSEITSDDLFLVKLLRKSGKKIHLTANKCETTKQDEEAIKFISLGLGEPINISAEHNRGIQDLKSKVFSQVDQGKDDAALLRKSDKNKIKISILGRPNSGKSTLTNFLLNSERQLVGELSGLTRDTISEEFVWNNKNYIIIDTPGLRKKSKIIDLVEKKSTKNSLKSVDESDISILIVDSSVGFDKQDLLLSNYIEEKGKPFILAINKWDLVKNKKEVKNLITYKVSKSFSQNKGVYIVYISSKEGFGIENLMENILKIYNLSFKKLKTNKLNEFLDKITSLHIHPTDKGKEIRFKYMTQIKTNPISFVIFTNKPQSVLDSYKKYILNNIREEFSLNGVPIRVIYKKTTNPYDKKS